MDNIVSYHQEFIDIIQIIMPYYVNNSQFIIYQLTFLFICPRILITITIFYYIVLCSLLYYVSVSVNK